MGWIKDIADLARPLIERLVKSGVSADVQRPFLVEPLRTTDARLGKHLVETVRSGAGVPLVCCRRETRFGNLMRWTRLYCVLQDTTPKSVFEVVEWRHIPAEYLDGEVVYQGSAGSVLFFHLADRERREHFERSANVGVSGSRRPIVLLKAEDLCNSSAWLRRIDVNVLDAGLDDNSRTGVALPSSLFSRLEGTATSRIRQKEVPPDAIWLVCDDDDLKPPSPDWGDEPESSRATLRPVHMPGVLEHLGKQAKRWRQQKWLFWFAFGLVPAAFTMYGSFVDDPGNFQIGMRVFSIFWLSATAVAAGISLWIAWRGSSKESKWEIGEEIRAKWTGGTARGMFLGQLLKEVTFKNGKGWSELWANTWPATGSSDNAQHK